MVGMDFFLKKLKESVGKLIQYSDANKNKF